MMQSRMTSAIRPKARIVSGTGVVLLGFFAAILLVTAVNAAELTEKPNIVLILVDDLGNRSLSCFGGTIPTPNLDRLAREGMVFQNAHAAPMCAPTRDEMFTGISRARFKGRPGIETPFFTSRLQQLGYQTGMAGKWFVGSVFDPPRRGFDEALIMVNGYRHWCPDVMLFGSGGMMEELNQPEITARLNEWEIPRDGDGPHRATRLLGRHADDVSADFLSDFIRRHRDGPFFAYYSSKLAHVPHAPTPDGDSDQIAVFRKGFLRSHDRNLKELHPYVNA
ncbi:MAG TPA: sulfatase-like hydrolase/transferase, partial [Thermoguttaceae bacterium]|nr:sulfatase-like hydrolase/transferase [Thermoguttaceae bacterium]